MMAAPICTRSGADQPETSLKTPNYRQEKKRREDAQKKRNAEEQERQAARKKGVPAPAPTAEK
jgi:hypothetical protein